MPPRLDGLLYRNFLQQDLPGLIAELNLSPQIVQRMIYMHDGAPPHWRDEVTRFLNTTYPNRWIGRFSGYMPWPARSPDFNPLDYFLWGYVKNQVYNTSNILSQEVTWTRIQEAFNSLRQDPEMLRSTSRDIVRRAHFVLGTNGQHFENLPNDHNFNEVHDND